MNVDNFIGKRMALWFHAGDRPGVDEWAVIIGTVHRDGERFLMHCSRTATIVALRPAWVRRARLVLWPLKSVLLDADYCISLSVRELPPEADLRWHGLRYKDAPPSVN